jgi:hypothetical protein
MKVSHLKRFKKIEGLKKATTLYPNDGTIVIHGRMDEAELERIKRERTARSGVTKFFVFNIPNFHQKASQSIPPNSGSIEQNALPSETK